MMKKGADLSSPSGSIMANRPILQLWSATDSQSLIPQSFQPVRTVRLSFPHTVKNSITLLGDMLPPLLASIPDILSVFGQDRGRIFLDSKGFGVTNDLATERMATRSTGRRYSEMVSAG